VNVLLLGGKGAGKNELARYIHQCSGRQEGNMFTLTIPLNASIAGMNAALFGVGNAAKDGEAPGPGLLERASGSTLYIEHLERLPPVTRSQLRTALQSGSTRRLGETEQRRIDVRLISATTVSELADTNLPPNVLAYLAPIQLTLPDLGHREQDIHAMAERVLASPGRPRAWIGPRFAHALKGQAWKQNLDSLRTTLSWLRHHPLDADPLQQARITDHIILSRGNVTEVAGKLGVSTEALFRYLARFDIDLEEEDLSPST
jgi:arginine utilization regulatory protein